jgi:hypothetical protein
LPFIPPAPPAPSFPALPGCPLFPLFPGAPNPLTVAVVFVAGDNHTAGAVNVTLPFSSPPPPEASFLLKIDIFFSD